MSSESSVQSVAQSTCDVRALQHGAATYRSPQAVDLQANCSCQADSRCRQITPAEGRIETVAPLGTRRCFAACVRCRADRRLCLVYKGASGLPEDFSFPQEVGGQLHLSAARDCGPPAVGLLLSIRPGLKSDPELRRSYHPHRPGMPAGICQARASASSHPSAPQRSPRQQTTQRP